MRQKRREKSKKKLIGFLKRVKSAGTKKYIKKHHKTIHSIHQALKKHEVDYKAMLKRYDSYLKKFRNAQKSLDRDYNALLKNKLNKKQLSKLDAFTKKVLKKLK